MHCLIVLWPGSVAVRWCSPPPGGSVVTVPLRADHLLKFAFRQVDEARARIAWMDITARYPSCGIMSTGKARGLRQFPLFTPLPPSRGKPGVSTYFQAAAEWTSPESVIFRSRGTRSCGCWTISLRSSVIRSKQDGRRAWRRHLGSSA